MKVYRLLDKAKRVIANENKKNQKDSFKTEQKFTKTKTSLASAGASIMNSANMTGGSYISVKDKALAKFDNVRTGADGV